MDLHSISDSTLFRIFLNGTIAAKVRGINQSKSKIIKRNMFSKSQKEIKFY